MENLRTFEEFYPFRRNVDKAIELIPKEHFYKISNTASWIEDLDPCEIVYLITKEENTYIFVGKLYYDVEGVNGGWQIGDKLLSFKENDALSRGIKFNKTFPGKHFCGKNQSNYFDTTLIKLEKKAPKEKINEEEYEKMLPFLNSFNSILKKYI